MFCIIKGDVCLPEVPKEDRALNFSIRFAVEILSSGLGIVLYVLVYG